MPELNFDLSTVAGIAAVTMFFLSTLKGIFPKQVENREPIIAVGLGLVISIAAHVTHSIAFKPGLVGWVQAIGAGLSVGVASQLGHDYAMNPVKEIVGGLAQKVLGLFSKKKEGGDAKTP